MVLIALSPFGSNESGANSGTSARTRNVNASPSAGSCYEEGTSRVAAMSDLKWRSFIF